MSLTLETFNIMSIGWVSDLPLAPVGTSTWAFGGSVLEGTKDLGQTAPSLFKFGFQDDVNAQLSSFTTIVWGVS